MKPTIATTLIGLMLCLTAAAQVHMCDTCSEGCPSKCTRNRDHSTNSNSDSNSTSDPGRHDLVVAPAPGKWDTTPNYTASYLRHLLKAPTPVINWKPGTVPDDVFVPGSDLIDLVRSLDYNDVDNTAFVQDWLVKLRDKTIIVGVSELELGGSPESEARDALNDLNAKTLKVVEAQLRDQLKGIHPFDYDTPEVKARKNAIVAQDEKDMQRLLGSSSLMFSARRIDDPVKIIEVQPNTAEQKLLNIDRDGWRY